jgi:hypothetical protein
MKAIIFFLFILFPFLVKGQCKEPVFEFLSAEVNGDSVVLKDNLAERNCGARYSMEIFSLDNNTLVWLQRDTGETMVCLCYFNLSVTIDSMKTGNYLAMVYYTYPDFRDSSYVGSVSFTITEPNSYLLPSIQNQNQSPCIVTGISSDNISTDVTLKIYPNPSSNQVTIETSEISNQTYLTILNLISEELINHQITEPKMILDISNLPSGLYIVRLMNDRSVETGMMVKL